jgi:DNA-binding transcriptional LysR family regulator
MDTRLISTFVAVARSGSFTAAGAELHLAQSTVTAHIQSLERELGVRLFDRLPAGAVLTEAGQRTLDRANRLLDAEADLRSDTDGPLEGTVAIGAPESLCAYLLPGVIASLHRNHPAVDVQLMPVGTQDAVEQLRSGRLSLAVMVEPSLADPDLVVEPVGTLELTFVGAPEHARAVRKDRWFLLEEGCAYSDDVARLLETSARPRLTRLGSVEATRACVAEGLGLTLLPTFAVSEHLADGRLVRFDGPPVRQQSILLARHRRRSLGRAAHAVLDELRRGSAALATSPADPTAGAGALRLPELQE